MIFQRIIAYAIIAIALAACGSPQPAEAASKAQSISFLLSQVRITSGPLAGGKAYFYAAGTTTLKAVWTDRGKVTQAANPYTLDANATAQLYGDGIYRVVIKDSAGVTRYDRDNLKFSEMEGDATANVLNYGNGTLAAAVTAIGSTPTTLAFGTNQTLTANLTIPATIELMPINGAQIIPGAYTLTGLKEPRTSWFSNGVIGAAAAVANNGTVIVDSDITGINGKAKIAANNVTVKGNGFKTLTWSALGSSASYGSLGTGTAAFEVTGSNVTFENLSLVGPDVGTYSANAGLIVMVGISTASRKSGLALKNVELSKVGGYGVFTQFVDNITVDERCYFHNIGYSGMTHLSPRHVRVGGMRVKTITPGTSSNMYGMSFSHYSLNYHLDPAAGTPLAAHPFPQDVIVDGALVEDVNWNPIDFHGAYNSTVQNCRVYNSLHGIAVTSSSGDASGYVGSNNAILNNTVDGRNQDGTTSGRENTGHGIVAQGGVAQTHRGLTVSGNKIFHKGVVGNTDSGAILASYADGGVFSGNTIENWGGNAFLLNGSVSAVLSDNRIRGVKSAAESSSRAFSYATAGGANLTLIGNTITGSGGDGAADVGFRALSITVRPTLTGNDFSAAAFPYLLPVNGFAKGGDVGSVVTVTDLTTGLVSVAGTDKDCMVVLESAVIGSLTDLTGGDEGDVVTIINATANNATIVHNSAKIVNNTTADIVLGMGDAVAYRRWGAKWLQSSPLLSTP